MHRKDSWEHEDDLVLAEIVLNHVRSGSTQLKAFEEAAGRLTRTVSACGFRWNSELRKTHEKELDQAKNERKVNKYKSKHGIEVTMQNTSDNTNTESEDPVDTLIKSLEYAIVAAKQLRIKFEQLRVENIQLERKLEERTQGEDLASLMKLLDHARKLGLTTKENSAS